MPLSTLLHWLPGGGTILCFHGIRGETQPDGGGIHVRASFLRDAVAVAQSTGRIVPLREMIELARAGRSSAGLVALTFDDACRSVSEVALPILRAAGAPATVFAVRDASTSGQPYWWDRLSLVIPLLDPSGVNQPGRRSALDQSVWPMLPRSCAMPSSAAIGARSHRRPTWCLPRRRPRTSCRPGMIAP